MSRLLLVLVLAVAGCGGPESRVADLCRAAGNDRGACLCLEGELRDALSPQERAALVSAQLGADGLPEELSAQSAVAFSDAVATCQVRFEGGGDVAPVNAAASPKTP